VHATKVLTEICYN